MTQQEESDMKTILEKLITPSIERRWEKQLQSMRDEGDEPRALSAAEAALEYIRDFGIPSGSEEPTAEDIETILFA